jgi:2-haloalkanoic acid dehalogenase type II
VSVALAIAAPSIGQTAGATRRHMGDFDGYDTLSFDCYGTLIDWETGIAAALRPWADRNRLEVDDDELVAAFGETEGVVEGERPTDPYPEILAEVMRRIGDRLGGPVIDEEAAAFGASVGDWPAFPDTAEALARLGGRYRLVILSNVDRRSFAASNRKLGTVFDGIVTAEDVGTYKPHRAMFDALLVAVEAMGSERSRLLHVAESLYHDHQPAAEAGIDSVWIHRRFDRDGYGATHPPEGDVHPKWRFTSMAEFADAAVGERG